MSVTQSGPRKGYESAGIMDLKAKKAVDMAVDDDTVAFRQRTRSWDYVIRSGAAGGLAGCVAKTTVAPLDRVKILFQTKNPQFAKYTGSWAGVASALRQIYGHDGLYGLYRGHSATLFRIFPYAAIKFLAYEQFRAMFIRNKREEVPWRRFVSGALAGVTSVVFTYPLEVMRVRMAFETTREGHSSILSTCRQIYFENATPQPSPATTAAGETLQAVAPRSGIVNFYRGFSPTLLGILPYAGVSFLTHDTVGDLLRHPSVAKWTTLPQPKKAPRGKRVPLASWAQLIAGGLAGMISQTASYPLEIIRRRMQVGGAVGDGRRLRIAETAVIVFRERGIPGFFVGLTIGYVKVIPMGAVAFYVYERTKGLFGI